MSKKLLIALTFVLAFLVLAPEPSAQVTPARTTTGQVYLVGRFGRLLFSGRTTTDNATQNTWNVLSQAIAANELSANGQTIVYQVGILGANNANTHEYESYFSASTATCSGTGAAVCDTGCLILPSVTNTTAFAGSTLRVTITRTSSGNQDYNREITGVNTAHTVGTCAITDTAATKLVFATRNTSAAAASLAQLNYWVYKY